MFSVMSKYYYCNGGETFIFRCLVISFVLEVGPITAWCMTSIEGHRWGRKGSQWSRYLGMPFLFHSSLCHLAEDPVEETIRAHSPARSEPHLPVQDTGQECVLFCQRNVSCCSVTWFRGSWSYLGLFLVVKDKATEQKWIFTPLLWTGSSTVTQGWWNGAVMVCLCSPGPCLENTWRSCSPASAEMLHVELGEMGPLEPSS